MHKRERKVNLRCKLVRPEVTGPHAAPAYATPGAAGLDLAAALEAPVDLAPGETALLPTGLAIQLPGRDYAALIFPRSGLAARHGVTLVNAVGVVDADYTGEVFCPVINLGRQVYTIRPGDRIAQLVVVPVARAGVSLVTALAPTTRGEGGFGSTGR